MIPVDCRWCGKRCEELYVIVTEDFGANDCYSLHLECHREIRRLAELMRFLRQFADRASISFVVSLSALSCACCGKAITDCSLIIGESRVHIACLSDYLKGQEQKQEQEPNELDTMPLENQRKEEQDANTERPTETNESTS